MLSREDLEYVCEYGKYAVAEILRDWERLYGLSVDFEARTNGVYAELRRGTKEVRVILKESGKRALLDHIWVGVCERDYMRGLERPETCFIVVADMKLCHVVVAPFTWIKWRRFSGGRSFSIYVSGSKYYLGSSPRGVELMVDDLSPILRALT